MVQDSKERISTYYPKEHGRRKGRPGRPVPQIRRALCCCKPANFRYARNKSTCCEGNVAWSRISVSLSWYYRKRADECRFTHLRESVRGAVYDS